MSMSAEGSAWAGSQGMSDDLEALAVSDGGSVEPCFYTVEEAALILRIGRTTAYRLARLYIATGGAEGLPAILVGGQLRVPRVALERLAAGPVHLPTRRSKRPALIVDLRRSAG